ncbi:MAG: energy transducer TonB [Bryobacteraceae bacterium]
MRSCLLPAWFLTLTLMAAGQDPPRTMLRDFKPEYPPELATVYVLDPVKVAIGLDSQGVPYSLHADAGLPDNVVVALSEFRFTPGKPTVVSIIMPVRRAIDKAQVVEMRRWVLQKRAERPADFEKAEQELKSQTARVRGAAALLGDLYALAAMGVATPEAELVHRARAALAATGDTRIILSAMLTASAERHGFDEFCEALYVRAQPLYLEVPSCKGGGELAAEGMPTVVESAKILKQTKPIYPKEAKQHHVTGSNVFEATIGKDGMITRLEFLDGPLMFYQTSRAAVLQWTFAPAEVITRITVDYGRGR